MANRYQLIVFGGYSPYTTKPSTQFRQPAVGILRQPHCDKEYSGVRRPKQVHKPQRVGEIIHPVVYNVATTRKTTELVNDNATAEGGT